MRDGKMIALWNGLFPREAVYGEPVGDDEEVAIKMKVKRLRT